MHSIYFLTFCSVVQACYVTSLLAFPPQKFARIMPKTERSPTSVDLNPHFNQTHFIIGDTRPQKPSIIVARPTPTRATTPPMQVFFSPDDNVRAKLIEFITKEKGSIKIAAFSFTEPHIMDALYSAHQRGVTVECITDPSGLQDRNSKIGGLCDKGISVHVYNPSYQEKSAPSYMHHKFVLFENNDQGCPILWTGSLNLTKNACDKNQENVTVIWDKNVIKLFEKQFDTLKKRSKSYK